MKRHAFTLIELLFIVAIIAVLAAIAVPNFLEAQVRSKVGRTVGDMAVMEAALRSYHADWGVYPAHDPEVWQWVVAHSQARDGAMIHLEQAHIQIDPDDPDRTTRVDRAHRLTSQAGANRWGWGASTSKATPLDVSGLDMFPLTTPIAYFTHQLAIDTFNSDASLPLKYINLQQLARMNGGRDFIVNDRMQLQQEPRQAADPFAGEMFDDFGMGALFQESDWFNQQDPFGNRLPSVAMYIADPSDQNPRMRSRAIDGPTSSTVRLISDQFLLVSGGPSNTSDMASHDILWGGLTPYDPTNGTVSRGQIYTLGHGIRRFDGLGGQQDNRR